MALPRWLKPPKALRKLTLKKVIKAVGGLAAGAIGLGGILGGAAEGAAAAVPEAQAARAEAAAQIDSSLERRPGPLAGLSDQKTLLILGGVGLIVLVLLMNRRR